MSVLSIGKNQGMQKGDTPRSALAVFTLDHRNNLRRAFHPEFQFYTKPTIDAEWYRSYGENH
ncbi:MAG: hypothetical protein GY762_23580 [Proteobacteria bacterium]|nr:hypothetical protein [Pseudomonadota bacterium]